MRANGLPLRAEAICSSQDLPCALFRIALEKQARVGAVTVEIRFVVLERALHDRRSEAMGWDETTGRILS